jgi:hypothetical protein
LKKEDRLDILSEWSNLGIDVLLRLKRSPGKSIMQLGKYST